MLFLFDKDNVEQPFFRTARGLLHKIQKNDDLPMVFHKVGMHDESSQSTHIIKSLFVQYDLFGVGLSAAVITLQLTV